MTTPKDHSFINFLTRNAAAATSWRRVLESDRGGRAALRRCSSPQEVLALPAFHPLRLAVLGPSGGRSDPRVDALARAAIAGAELDWREPDSKGGPPQRFGAACAVRRGENPLIRPERFQVLVGTEDPALFLRLLRGAIAIADRELPLLDTMQAVFDWHWRGSRAKARRAALLSYFDGGGEEAQTGGENAKEAEMSA